MPSTEFQKPPLARRDDSVVEDLHGFKIADPYRWLEDPDAPETAEFVKQQNESFSQFIKQSTFRSKFQERLTKLFDYEKFGCPFKYGDFYFYFYNAGLDPQHSLYKQSSLEAPPELLLDPKSFSDDGTSALNTFDISDSGKLMAYALSQRGSDWATVRVRRVTDLHDYPDKLEWVKFSSISWTDDEQGFFYSRYPTPEALSTDKAGRETNVNLNQAAYYHKLGTDQAQDVKVFSTPENPKWMSSVNVNDDGTYAIVTISESTDPVNKLYVAKLTGDWLEKGLDVIKVVDNLEAGYEYITNDGPVFYFKTNKDAPKYKIVSLDISNTEKFEFRDVVPERAEPLDFVTCVNHDKLIMVYMRDVKHEMSIHKLATGELISKIDLPIGTVIGLTGKKKEPLMFYKFSSFTNPGVTYRYDFGEADPKPKLFRETQVADLDPSIFEVEQVFYPSKDGVKIPMFIISKKGMKLDGQNPVFLYGYGGFSISMNPGFSVSRLMFVQNLNGVVALPNLRGGGEYGEEWHKAGCLKNKQNVFDDFISAAEYLIEKKYTSANKICINGGSNGGLLVGACLNQRPDLFGAAIADVGVMDMLRFHKFTIGHAWMADYGNPDVKEDFEVLLKYSPLHNIRQNQQPYPAVLLLTGDHDDRVVPLHSLKYMAQLQYAFAEEPSQKEPLLIRVETRGGHGAGKPTKMIIEETTDRMAFAGIALGLEWRD